MILIRNYGMFKDQSHGVYHYSMMKHCFWLVCYLTLLTFLILVRNPLHGAVMKGEKCCSYCKTPGCDCLPRQVFPMSKLDTMRILVEEGQCDPMAIGWRGGTALHWYHGPVEGFNYLLRQDHFFVDLNHRNLDGYAAAMCQLVFSEPIYPDIVARAGEGEILAERQTESRHISPYPGVSQSDKDHYLATLFVQTLRRKKKHVLTPALRSVITDGANPHSVTPNQMYSAAAKEYSILELPSNSNPVTKSADLELQRCFRLWLRILMDAGVDVTAYLKEAERLAAQGKDEW